MQAYLDALRTAHDRCYAARNAIAGKLSTHERQQRLFNRRAHKLLIQHGNTLAKLYASLSSLSPTA